jgi:hypothetical protein
MLKARKYTQKKTGMKVKSSCMCINLVATFGREVLWWLSLEQVRWELNALLSASPPQ